MLKALKILLLQLFLLSIITAYGQNLVPNPSFEDTIACPNGIQDVVGWFRPTSGSSDLMHSCSFQVPQNFLGYQNAKTGNAYAGLYTYHPIWGADSSYREYISVKLMDSLEAGKTYNVEFYVSRSDSSHYATIMGAYLSSDSLYSSSAVNLPYTPQLEETTAIIDKIAWTKLNYQYIAAGGEKYLTIGNFQNDFLSDTVNTNDGGDVNSPDYMAAYYFIDDVSVVKDTTTGVNDFSIINKVSVYPNPITEYFQINTAFSKPYDLTVYNAIGQQLYQEKNITSNSKTIDATPFSKGILFISIKSGNQSISYKLLKQ